MARLFRDENKQEFQLALLTFCTLFGILCGHTILETARDALFVTRVPPTRLPFVYIAIAVIGVAVSRFATPSHGERRAYGISLSLVAAAVVDIAFWIALRDRGGFVVYAFYVWTGLFASWVITTFWIVLGQAVTISQAKRMYGPMSSGGLFGAVVGSATAHTIAQSPGLRRLILISAAISVLTAIGPALWFSRAVRRTQTAAPPRRRERTAEMVRSTFKSFYIPRVLMLVLCATTIATFADYLLKTEVATHIEKVKIGEFFATISFWMNMVALVLQLFFLDRLIRWAGIHRAIAIIPALFLILSVAGLAAPALILIVVVKVTDGALRTSLLKTGTELLLFPVDEELRPRAKVVVDLFGQRFGQAIASVIILGMAAVHANARELLAGVGVVALIWLALAPGIRKGYLALFRKTLAAGELLLDQHDLPPPDMDSLEALISALNSAKDAEVIAALDLLEEQGKAQLIPALILFHASAKVVTHALDILERAQRKDVGPVLVRLLEHGEPKVRAAALRVLAVHDAPTATLELYLDDQDQRVRATAIIALARRGVLSDEKLAAIVAEQVDLTHALQIGLMRAIRRQPDPRFVPLVLGMADTEDRGVLVAVARAMGSVNDPAFIPTLIRLLGYGDPREPARHALQSMGEPALRALDAALVDESTPYPVRRQIPRAMAGFGAASAAVTLITRLSTETDFAISRNVMRALLQIQKRQPSAVKDPELYKRLLTERIAAIRKYRGWHAAVESDAKRRADHHTPTGDLLSALLHEKESTLEGHVFGLLGLLDAREDYEAIFRGLQNSNKKAKSTSRELLENVIPKAVRKDVLELLDDQHPTKTPEIEPTLRSLLDQSSLTLATLAAYHATEIGLKNFEPPSADLPIETANA